jgi:hypothetical protein
MIQNVPTVGRTVPPTQPFKPSPSALFSNNQCNDKRGCLWPDHAFSPVANYGISIGAPDSLGHCYGAFTDKTGFQRGYRSDPIASDFDELNAIIYAWTTAANQTYGGILFNTFVRPTLKRVS